MNTTLGMNDLDCFDFELPPGRIAQVPVESRERSRLLVLSRATQKRTHAHVCELPRFLRPGDLLVVNRTRVLSARLRGRKASGGRIEALLLGRGDGDVSRALPARPLPSHAEPSLVSARVFRALVRGSGGLREGQKLFFGPDDAPLCAEVLSKSADGEVILSFESCCSPYAAGEMPLPPYIRRTEPQEFDRERYQTVFAKEDGSVAAPTAGLHFTQELLERLREGGVELAEVTLHVGPGTFRPLQAEQLAQGKLHAEFYELPVETAKKIERTRERGGRVVAVGTTTTRVLETCARRNGSRCVRAGRGFTEIFLYPGHPFRVVDVLMTNFHLPRSSLLLLVAAFAGREEILDAYAEAIREGYRFFSYGDAMLIE